MRRAPLILCMTIIILSKTGFSHGEVPDLDPSVFDDFTSEELLEMSFDSERGTYRNFLAEHRPDTPQGLFCRAWVAQKLEAVALYKELLRRYPDEGNMSKVALINLMFELKSGVRDDRPQFKDVEPFYEQAIDLDPYLLVYRHPLIDGSEEDWAAFKEGHKEDVFDREPLLLEFLEAKCDAHRGNWNSVRDRLPRLYENWGQLDRLPMETLTEAVLDWEFSANVFQERTNDERVEAMSTWLETFIKATNHRADGEREKALATVLVEVATRLRDLSERDQVYKQDIRNLLSNSYSLDPRGDAVWMLVTLLDKTYYPWPSDELLEILDSHAEVLHHSPQYHRARARLLLKLNRHDQAADVFRLALARAFDESNRFQIAREYAWGYWMLVKGKPETALAILKRFTTARDVTVRRDAHVQCAILTAQQLRVSEAHDWLDGYRILDDANQSFCQGKMKELDDLTQFVNQRDDYFIRNPFHKMWLEKFGLAGLRIQFAADSAILDESGLASIGGIRSSVELKNVVFSVVGVQTFSEVPGVAQDRADAVGAQLQMLLGLKREQVQTRTMQIATSTTPDEAGHVEIHYAGLLTEQKLVTRSSLPDHCPILSSDGRLGVFRDEIWDIDRRVKLGAKHEVSTMDVTTGEFSPTGQWLADFLVFGSIELLVVYDAYQAEPVYIHPVNSYMLGSLAWNSDGTAMSVSNSGERHEPVPSGICILDPSTGKHQAGAFVDNTTIDGMVWVGRDKFLAAMPWAADRVPFLSTTSWDVVHEVQEPDYAHAITATPDHSRVLITDDSRRLHIYNVEQGFECSTLETGGAVKGTLECHPREPLVLCNDMRAADIRIFDYKKMEQISRWTLADSSTSGTQDAEARWIDNGNRVLVQCEEFGFREFSLSLDSYVPFESTAADLRNRAAFSDAEKLVTVDSEGVHVWDITTGQKLHGWPGAEFHYVGRLQEADDFVAIQEDRSIAASKLYRFSLSDYSRDLVCELGNFDLQKHCIRNDLIVMAGTEFSVYGDSISDGRILVVDNASDSIVSSLPIDMRTEPLERSQIYRSEFRMLAVNNSASEAMIVTSWEDGLGWRMTNGRQVRFLDLSTGDIVDQTRFASSSPKQGFYEGTDYYRLVFNASDDELYKRADHEFVKRVTVAGRAHQQEYGYDELFSHAFADRNLKVAVSDSNEILFSRRDTGELMLTLLAQKNNQWLAVAPTGEFSSSLLGDNNVYWRIGQEYLPLDALRENYERPDLIKAQLDAIARKDVVAEAQTVGAVPSRLFAVPFAMSLVSDQHVRTADPEYSFDIDVSRLGDEMETASVEYVHNGRVLQNTNILRGDSGITGQKARVSQNIRLVDGINIIEARLVINDARVLPVTVRVDKSSLPVDISGPKPNLWFFGVGVSKYADEEQNLDFAEVDARSLAQSFELQEGLLYGQVETMVLSDSEATSQDIRVSLVRFLRNASSQDLVMIYLAGHGAKDDQQNLYFIAHDGLVSEALTGLEIDFFRKVLLRRPENQKAVLMLDICHAGAAAKSYQVSTLGSRGASILPVSGDSLVRKLSLGTGTVVLASSSGSELSVEGKQYAGGHGAFTSTILEGLSGSANILEKDDAITVNELTAYVCDRVPAITDNQQHPTTPHASNVRDFPVARLLSP